MSLNKESKPINCKQWQHAMVDKYGICGISDIVVTQDI